MNHFADTTKTCPLYIETVSLLTVYMRGFVVSILFILISAQVEASVCSHFGNLTTPKATASYSNVDAAAHSNNGSSNLLVDEMCFSCGHTHLVFSKESARSLDFTNSNKRVLDFQNKSFDSRSVQPPIDPPRA